MTDIVQSMTTWAEELTWANIPEDVRVRAGQALTDTVATMTRGARTEAGRIALGHAARAVGRSPLVGRGTDAMPAEAAFGNGVAASALDFDDGHYLGGAIHPAACIVPALIATAGPQTSVRELLTAQVVGYEIGLRAAHTLWAKHETGHYHATGTAGAIGAAVGAAKLLGLDADGIARAVKIAWAHAPMSTYGTPMVKESIGWGAMTGVAAAELAEAGFMRVPTDYDEEDAIDAALPPSPFHQPGVATDSFVTSFGETWEVRNTYFKQYAACRYTHAAALGFSELLATHGITAADIVSVRVGTQAKGVGLDYKAPRTIETAQYSFPIVLASIALWGAAGPEEIAESDLADPQRLELASRIEVAHDADLDPSYPRRYPSRISITTAEGTVTGVYHDAPGDPGVNFGPPELKAKWRRLLGPVIGDEVAAAVITGLADPSARLHAVLEPVWAARS